MPKCVSNMIRTGVNLHHTCICDIRTLGVRPLKMYCNQCDYQATLKSLLTVHNISNHEGVRYVCNKCEFQAK